MKNRKKLLENFPPQLTEAIKGNLNPLTEEEKSVLAKLSAIDWTQQTLSLSNPEHIEMAALAVSLGAVVAYSFGNFNAITSHPHKQAVQYVNITKGRPENQVGSITTTKQNIKSIFDWSKIPKILNQEKLLKLIDAIYEIGPFGFRGPASRHIPEHLIKMEDGIRTAQLITPGYACPSNRLVEKILEATKTQFLHATSPNISRHLTGSKEESAHYKMAGVQQEFGAMPGYFMIAHTDETQARAAYPKHELMSTSILAFHKARLNEKGQPILTLERHGSLHFDEICRIVRAFDFDIEKGVGAQNRLSIRQY